jgi:hypothetical protein
VLRILLISCLFFLFLQLIGMITVRSIFFAREIEGVHLLNYITFSYRIINEKMSYLNNNWQKPTKRTFVLDFQKEPLFSNQSQSRLYKLSQETQSIVNQNHSRTEIEKDILSFLSEDSIIERTGDCKNYFQQHVSPIGVMAKVKKKSITFFNNSYFFKC